MAAVRKALDRIGDTGLLLDAPCGSGRFFELLSKRGVRFVGTDLSEAMLLGARAKANGAGESGLVMADINALPFADGAFGTLMCIRFLFHLSPEERVTALREMSRVTRGYLVLDYRLFFSGKNILRLIVSRFKHKRPLYRPNKREMLGELARAGLEAVAIFPVTRVFSDKYIVLCGKRDR